MKKLIFLSLIIMVLLSVATFKVTKALFSDSAASTANTFAAASVFPTVTPTPTSPVADHLVISEVQIAGTASAAQDFVEMYNPTNSAIDLNGHRLVKRTASAATDAELASWSSSTLIQPHKYYLWATSDNSFATSINADISSSDNLAANSSVALRQGNLNTGTIIDAVAWNTSNHPLKEGNEYPTDPGAGQSLERKALSTASALSMAVGGSDQFKGNGYDTNNNADDFILRLISLPQNSGSSAETP